MSTFCRSCGEHFRIKDGVAVAPRGANVSGIATFRDLGKVREIENTAIARHNRAVEAQPAPKKEKLKTASPEKKQDRVTDSGSETWLEKVRKTSPTKIRKRQSETEGADDKSEKDSEKTAPPEKLELPVSEIDEPTTNPIALAAAEAAEKEKAVLELEAAQAKQDAGDEEVERQLGADAQPKEALAGGSMEALLGGLSTDVSADEKPAPEPAGETSDAADTGPLDPAKMPADFAPTPAKKSDDANMRTVRCFKCNHQQQVSYAAASSQCGRCSVYISLSDYDIKTPQSQTIRTRGNVTVHRRGSLTGCDIACHDLIALGKISCSVDCSGNATFKNSGKVIGSMHCKHLHIDKKAELTFPQGVIAESADIHGTLNGDITCSGTVKIFKTGAVNGDATAKGIVLKDGGILSGQMSIQHNVDIELPVKPSYNPSVIS